MSGHWGGRRVQVFTRLVLQTYGTTCHLCGRPGAHTTDHLIPRSKGGAPFDLTNARPAHQSCNRARWDLDLEEWFRMNPLPRRAALTPSREW